jgi:lysozyme
MQKVIPKTQPLEGELFEDWFVRQKFKNFRAYEFTEYFTVSRRGVKNSEPPRELWPNIVPTLRIVDDLRTRLGRSCVILSSYRSPAYNAPIDGAAKHSFHTQFQALDISFAGHSPRRIHEELTAMRNAKRFRGGLALYSSFVHIDTRGTNANW